MTKREPTPDDYVKAMIAAAADWIPNYVGRGRPLAGLGDEELKLHFVQAYRAWAADPLNFALGDRAEDANCEFKLRDQTPPDLLVAAELNTIRIALRLQLDEPHIREVAERVLKPIAKTLLDPKAKH